MSFSILVICSECDNPMQYCAEQFSLTGICYWMCWDCELTVESTDFRHCLINRGVPIDQQKD